MGNNYCNKSKIKKEEENKKELQQLQKEYEMCKELRENSTQNNLFKKCETEKRKLEEKLEACKKENQELKIASAVTISNSLYVKLSFLARVGALFGKNSLILRADLNKELTTELKRAIIKDVSSIADETIFGLVNVFSVNSFLERLLTANNEIFINSVYVCLVDLLIKRKMLM